MTPESPSVTPLAPGGDRSVGTSTGSWQGARPAPGAAGWVFWQSPAPSCCSSPRRGGRRAALGSGIPTPLLTPLPRRVSPTPLSLRGRAWGPGSPQLAASPPCPWFTLMDFAPSLWASSALISAIGDSSGTVAPMAQNPLWMPHTSPAALSWWLTPRAQPVTEVFLWGLRSRRGEKPQKRAVALCRL